MARVRSVDDKAVFVFVSDAFKHHSEWLESVSPTDQHGRNALEFPFCRIVSSWLAVLLTSLVTDSNL